MKITIEIELLPIKINQANYKYLMPDGSVLLVHEVDNKYIVYSNGYKSFEGNEKDCSEFIKSKFIERLNVSTNVL